MTWTESELKSTKFIVSISIRVRGRRTYTNPIMISAKDLKKDELELLTNCILRESKRNLEKKNEFFNELINKAKQNNYEKHSGKRISNEGPSKKTSKTVRHVAKRRK